MYVIVLVIFVILMVGIRNVDNHIVQGIFGIGLFLCGLASGFEIREKVSK